MTELPQMQEVWTETLHWQPDLAQQEQFQRLFDLTLEGNRQFNLTRITEPEEFWEKHIWDSLRGVRRWLRPSEDENTAIPETVIDIGTGAGFPGIPVAIAFPQATVTLLDSTRKKITFLQGVTSTLELCGVRAVCDRAETIGHDPQHRNKYDLVLIRAVASANTCAEYVLPLLKLGGTAILYRGQWTSEEEDALKRAGLKLGGAIAWVDAFTTPLSQGTRHCVGLKKIAPTPFQFPRAIGIPVQKPLN